MELPEGVQAYFILRASNISEETEKLARGTATLNYQDMKDKIMKIFGDPGIQGEKCAAPEVKQEVLYGRGYK